MLEFHINRGIPLIIIKIIINVIRDVVDDYVMIVFIVNIVIYQHKTSINEIERGSKW